MGLALTVSADTNDLGFSDGKGGFWSFLFESPEQCEMNYKRHWELIENGWGYGTVCGLGEVKKNERDYTQSNLGVIAVNLYNALGKVIREKRLLLTRGRWD